MKKYLVQSEVCGELSCGFACERDVLSMAAHAAKTPGVFLAVYDVSTLGIVVKLDWGFDSAKGTVTFRNPEDQTVLFQGKLN